MHDANHFFYPWMGLFRTGPARCLFTSITNHPIYAARVSYVCQEFRALPSMVISSSALWSPHPEVAWAPGDFTQGKNPVSFNDVHEPVIRHSLFAYPGVDGRSYGLINGVRGMVRIIQTFPGAGIFPGRRYLNYFWRYTSIDTFTASFFIRAITWSPKSNSLCLVSL